ARSTLRAILTYEYDGQNRTTRQNRTLIRRASPTSRHQNLTSTTRTSARPDTTPNQATAPDNPAKHSTTVTAPVHHPDPAGQARSCRDRRGGHEKAPDRKTRNAMRVVRKAGIACPLCAAQPGQIMT